MPLVHVELIEGRSQEQLKQLVADITDAVTKNTGAPAVILDEMRKDRYAVAGVLKSDEK